ncbi:MAG: DNA methyltransferase [Armatimonadota bacterium]
MSDTVHPRNRLNELTNREWLIETKSFWHSEAEDDLPRWFEPELIEQFGLWLAEQHGEERASEMMGQLFRSTMRSSAPPRDKLKATHPATFSERDIARLIRFFTKSGQVVLDPFVGSGSTLLACEQTDRIGIGIELIERWVNVTTGRLEAAEIPHRLVEPNEALDATGRGAQVLMHGDARGTLGALPDECVDFIVTSPPYWSILQKRGAKAAQEREQKGLPTQYSESDADLGNIEDYDAFLDRLGEVFSECARVLRVKQYMCVVVADFRHGPQFHLYHADIARMIEDCHEDLQLKGLTVLLQDSKGLYALGIPYAFVGNIHHQFVLVFQRMD